MKFRINPFLRVIALPAIVSMGISASRSAAQSIKADNANDLDLSGSWTNNSVPTGALAIWNNIVTGASTTTIGAGVSFNGVSITDPTGNVSITSGSGGTLSLGSAGIDMSTSASTLAIGSSVNISADQAWKTGVSGAAGSDQITVTGLISGSGKLALDASNTRAVALSAANDFTGGFTLNPGSIVRLGAAATQSSGNTTASPLGAYDGNQVLTINGGRINNTNLAVHARNATINGDFVFSTTARADLGGTFDLAAGTRIMTLTRSVNATNTVILGGNNALRFGNTGNATFGNGTLRITADSNVPAGSFVPVIASAGTAFSGNAGLILGEKVVYSAGTGSLSVATSVPSVTLEAGSYWNLAEGANARNPQVNSLAGAGTVINLYSGATAGFPCTLTIKGNSGGSTDFSGSIVDVDAATFPSAANGIVGVTKAGNTTQILSGTNTYSGPTSVTGGKLVTSTKSNNGSFSTSAGTTLGVKVDAPGNDLDITGLTCAASTLEIDLNHLGTPSVPIIANAGDTTLNGNVTVNILNAGPLTTGTFTLLDTVGIRSGSGSYHLGTLPIGVNATLNEVAGDLTLTVNSIDPVYQWTGNTNNIWNSSGTNINWNLSGIASAYSDTPAYDVVLGESATGSTNIEITAALSPKSTTIDAASRNYALSGSGRISGSGGLNKKGSSTVTVATANNYTGATNIDAGTFRLGASNVLPDGTVNLTGTLDLAGFNDAVDALAGTGQVIGSTAGAAVLTVGDAGGTSSFAGTIGGTVGLAKTGSGTFSLTGLTSHTGATLISSGTLEIGSGGGSGVLSPASSLTNNATLRINRGTTATQGTDFPDINGSGAVVKVGSGTTEFNSANGYSGITTIEAGSLALAAAGALGSGANGTIASGAASILLRNGITVSGETATITGFGNGSRGIIRADGADAQWAGPIVVVSGTTETRLGGCVNGSHVLTLSGPISGGDPTNIADADPEYNGYPVTVSVRTAVTSDVVVLSGASGFAGNFGIFAGETRLDGGDNRLPATARLLMAFPGLAAKLDLNGRNQQLAGLYNYHSDSGALAVVTNDSATAATLTVNSTDTGAPAAGGVNKALTPTFTGTLTGNLAFVKAGTGDLTFTATTDHGGGTTVNGGILTLGSGSNNTSLADAADLVIGASGTLKLDYAGTDIIDQLTIAGVGKAIGVYGRVGSGAQFTDPHLTGDGTLTVTNGPSAGGSYASWADDPLKGNIPGEPALGDFDHDGLANLTEYALGLNPRISSLPPGTFSGGTLAFGKGSDAIANSDVMWVIEESADLKNWSPAVTHGAGNPSASISHLLAAGQVRVFARLKVTQVP